jgi:hypothetical protein
MLHILYFYVLNLEDMLLNDANLTFPMTIFNPEFQILQFLSLWSVSKDTHIYACASAVLEKLIVFLE